MRGPPCSSASRSPANAPIFRSSRTRASVAPCASPSSPISAPPRNSPPPARWPRCSLGKPTSPIKCFSSMHPMKTPMVRSVCVAEAHRRALAVRQDMGAARDRGGSWRSTRGPRRFRRHSAPDIRVGFGSRLLVLDGGLRHFRRRGIGSASLLPRHGLARRRDGVKERGRPRATFASRT